jgi:hypothetical protein
MKTSNAAAVMAGASSGRVTRRKVALQAGVEVRPEISHQAQHDGCIVEDVRQQDGTQGVDELDGCLGEVKYPHQSQV